MFYVTSSLIEAKQSTFKVFRSRRDAEKHADEQIQDNAIAVVIYETDAPDVRQAVALAEQGKAILLNIKRPPSRTPSLGPIAPKSASPKYELGMWEVHDHPEQPAQRYVARFFAIDRKPGSDGCNDLMSAAELAAIGRVLSAKGFIKFEPLPSSARSVVEVWL